MTRMFGIAAFMIVWADSATFRLKRLTSASTNLSVWSPCAQFHEMSLISSAFPSPTSIHNPYGFDVINSQSSRLAWQHNAPVERAARSPTVHSSPLFSPHTV